MKNFYAFTDEINKHQHIKQVDVTNLTVSRLMDMLSKDLEYKSSYLDIKNR